MREQSEEMSAPNRANALATAPDTAVFWSGTTQDIGGEVRAAQIAQEGNGKTLEMVLGERGIDMPKWDRSAESKEAWREASARFAAGASGTVRAVLGEDVREDSIWSTTEYPALLQNARVTRIIAIDPATLQETMLFDRAAQSARDGTVRQEVEGQDTHLRAAEAFMNAPKESAIEQHPQLVSAYAAITVIDKHVHASGLSDEQHARVLGAARENIANGIKQGHYPDIKLRDKIEASSDREYSYER